MAKQQFQEARDLAANSPTITANGPARWSYLLATMQYAAEAGLWDVAGNHYRDVEKAAAELIALDLQEPPAVPVRTFSAANGNPARAN